MVVNPSEDGAKTLSVHDVSTYATHHAIQTTRGAKANAHGSVNCKLGVRQTDNQSMPLQRVEGNSMVSFSNISDSTLRTRREA